MESTSTSYAWRRSTRVISLDAVDPVGLPEARLGGGGNAAHVKRSGRPTRVMRREYYMFHVKQHETCNRAQLRRCRSLVLAAFATQSGPLDRFARLKAVVAHLRWIKRHASGLGYVLPMREIMRRHQLLGAALALAVAFAGSAFAQQAIGQQGRDAAAQQYRWSSLILGIVESPAFLTWEPATESN